MVAIGLASGLFGALFGVGGGLIIVPLLIMLGGFASRRASGTSLAAICFTAVFGAIAYGALGDVDWLAAVEVGLPAAVGVVGGTALQQRLSARGHVLAFAVFLVAIAVRLLVT